MGGSEGMRARLLSMQRNPVGNTAASTRTIAFLGDYLPRKCGIATFTTDLLAAVSAEHREAMALGVLR